MAETKAKKGKISPDEILVKLCEEIVYDKKGENILRLDLREYSALCDYFLLCTATSSPHVGALAERIRREVLEQLKIKPLHMDGTAESGYGLTSTSSNVFLAAAYNLHTADTTRTFL